MRRLWILLPCALLLLVSACGPKPRYSGNVETGRVTEHTQSATAEEVAGPADEGSTEDAKDVVHATRTGERYHRASCRYLSKSDIPMSRAEAEAKGLTPCKVCKP